ncbi:glutamine synthetase family protein [Pseudoroseicyclus sp. CXY001]|uniref:glutamine synthetase family protein n=1 Tax=Pseudoroseicyclus sp. CXY001 TaxID=3242492 RepID=UPI00358DAE48
MNDITEFYAALADLNGIYRGKRLEEGAVQKALGSGIRMPLTIAGMDVWGADIDGNPKVFEDGDADGVAEPIGTGFLPTPWNAPGSALFPVWLRQDDGRPYGGDPRRVLGAIVAAFREAGLTPVMATELEFYLVERKGESIVPAATGPGKVRAATMAITELEAYGPYIREVSAACRSWGLPLDTVIAENGPGQLEVNFKHAPDPLAAADHAQLFKHLAAGIARTHGWEACFMAKPFSEEAGNGLHVHVSLLDEDGRNIFDDGSARGAPALGHAVGGLRQAMHQSALIFAPHFNSYRRLRPASYAPVNTDWGHEDRMAAIRIPGGPAAARRLEHRVAGADANPYLVIAAILCGILHGLTHKIDPDAPLADPRLPEDWGAAIAAFEAAPILRSYLPELFFTMFAECKAQERGVFAAHVSPFEIDSYLRMT